MQLYRQESGNPKINAQRNLSGRSHYVDDATLRFFKSRVITTRVTHGGLIFSIVTSDALDPNNTKRGFRYAIFDLFGEVIARTEIEGAFRTSAQACKARDKVLADLPARVLTLQALADCNAAQLREMERTAKMVTELKDSSYGD